MNYCTCDKPEPEEVECNTWECLKCEKEIEPYTPDIDLMHDSWNEDRDEIINCKTV